MSSSSSSSSSSDESRPLTLIVKLPSGVVQSQTFSTSTTLRDLRARCATLASSSATKVTLLCSKKPLPVNESPSATLASVGVANESTIQVVPASPPADIDVMVKTPSGSCRPVRINPFDDVSAFRAKVAGGEDLPPSRIQLTFQGRQLIDGLCCGDVGLTQECTVRITVLDPPPAASSSSARSGPAPVISDADRQKLFQSFQASKEVDVLFCFDTTGSMYSCLAQVRDNIAAATARLVDQIPNIRLAIMAIGDYCDAPHTYVTSHIDFTNDPKKLSSFAQKVRATGGGDTPEAYELCLREARYLSWRPDSSKALVMIADAEPHPASYTTEKIFWKDQCDELAKLGVKIYGVHAGTMVSSKPFYEEMARRTGGVYVKFENFSLITDMFLAVCYRETDQESFTKFTNEVKAEGRMNAQMGTMLGSLAQPNMAATAKPQERKIKEAWWDRDYDTLDNPQYSFTGKTWVPYAPSVRFAPRRKSTGCANTVAVLGGLVAVVSVAAAAYKFWL